MIVRQLPVGPLQANCYLVADEASRRAAVIDPGDEAPLILQVVEQLHLLVEVIILTHGHFDHIGAAAVVKKATGAPLLAHEAEQETLQVAQIRAKLFAGLEIDESPQPDRLLKADELISVGLHSLTVLHTPGHSPGHITLVGEGGAFVGDVVFAGSIGRTDLPGGDYQLLLTSIRRHILTLPDNTILYPGHGPATTVGRERNTNPFLVNLMPDARS